MNLILISMGVLGVIAFLAACLLYVVSLYFKVEADPLCCRVLTAADVDLPAAVTSPKRASRPTVSTA